MRIDVYSHSFEVKEVSGRQKEAVEHFCRSLVQYEFVKEDGIMKRKPARVFASAFKDRRYYRFHVNLLDDFLKMLAYYQIANKEFDKHIHTADIRDEWRVEFNVKSLFDPRDQQPALIDHILNPGSNKIINLQTGGGKAQPLHAKIRIPGGWTTMGKIKVGDEVVSKDGSATKVTGVYPQGVLQLYRITFADGRWTECCADHLWKVYYINTGVHNRWRVVNTLEVMRLISMPNPRVYVELIDPEEGVDVDLPIDPYVMGILLGDGHLGENVVYLATADQEIADAVSAELPEDLQLTHAEGVNYRIVKKQRSNGPNAFVQHMRRLGLAGKLSHEKKTPQIYLEASRSQKLALLQGLLDSDGSVKQSGSVSFYSSSAELAGDVQYLARSLGAYASIHHKQTSFTHNGEKKQGRPSYRVSIRYRKPSDLFRLTRKKERANDENQYAADLKLRVKSVIPTTVEKAQCISVDHPDRLYVTDDFIVTHNTFITKYAMNKMGLRTVGIMKGGFIDRWVPDLEDTFKFKRGELLVVRGGQSLNAIMEMALENEFSNVTCVMMSINTYSEYLKDYEENGLSDQYPIAPGQFFQRMGFGFGFLDEGHQNPHQVMKMFSYMHVHKFLTLSATLDTQDKFMTRMYEVMYPREDRFNAGFYRVYIRVKGIRYQIRRPKAIRYKGFGGAYSHTAFEASLMRDKNRVELKNYIDLIMWTLKTNFLDVMEKGQKAIIFCGTIKFCTLLTKYLQQQIRHLKVVRYVGADKMSVLNDGEIIVSTVLSAGTAVDIPNLRVGIMTTAVDSQQSNEQTMGRTRPLKDWPDVDPFFIFFCCTDIPQHVKYGQNKEGFFKNKVKSFGYEQAPISV